MFIVLAYVVVYGIIACIAAAIFHLVYSTIKREMDLKKQTKKLDMDKIAQGLGAERGGELKTKGGYFGALGMAANRPPVTPTIIEAEEDFQVKLEDALTVAGLPADTKDIIGRMFQFQAALSRNAEWVTIIGTITGLEISNQDKGVNLFISAHRFKGNQITHLHIEYNEHLTKHDCFLAFTDKSTVKGQFCLM